MTLHCVVFGGHIEIVEVDELSHIREAVTKNEIENRIQVLRTCLTYSPIVRI